ncbi:MAG: flavin reductase [Clostridia bacterium]|nr:flavin reductase [Clostridia bacterium]
MSDFKSILPSELKDNPFDLIGKEWMLVTAGNMDSYNTMTASWGGVGFLWNKSVCHVYIRHSRYTKEFLEREGSLTLSFFGDGYRDALTFCGKNSGRNVDKAKECGLTPIQVGDSVAFAEARLIIRAQVSYKQDMDEACFIDKSLLANYKDGDFHRIYTCEIKEVLVK